MEKRLRGKKKREKPIGLKRKASRKLFYLPAISEEGFAPLQCWAGEALGGGL